MDDHAHDNEWSVVIHMNEDKTLVKTAPTLLAAMGLLASLEDRLGPGNTSLERLTRGITISRGDRIVCDNCRKEYEGEKDS